jgi:hypothetical protein
MRTPACGRNWEKERKTSSLPALVAGQALGDAANGAISADLASAVLAE